MSQGFVLMGMAVRSRCQRIVVMMVMAVVMPVGVLMIQGIMNVAVGMGFCQVEQHAEQHQHSASGHEPTCLSLTERKGRQRAHERCKRKYRARARRPEGALGEQVKAQAQTVPGGADREQAQGSPGRRRGLAQAQRQHGRDARAQGRLGQHDLRRVALGQCTRQAVVHAPGRCGQQHREQAHQLEATQAPLVEHQQRCAREHQEHGGPDASAHRLVVQLPGQERREQRLQGEHQGRAGAAGALQSPGQRHGPKHGPETGHGPQAREVAALQARLHGQRLPEQQPHDGRTGVQQGGRAEDAQARPKALHERRAQAEQDGREQGQCGALQRRVGPQLGHQISLGPARCRGGQQKKRPRR